MKKLLIIQTDPAYFLFELIQLIETSTSSLRDFEVTIFADPVALKSVYRSSLPTLKGITCNWKQILETKYDVSVNLSINEPSWDLHHQIEASRKIGPIRDYHQFLVNNDWSNFLLTLKTKTPFLSFHLRDIYKNILGIKNPPPQIKKSQHIKQIIYSPCSQHLFSANDQEKFLETLSNRFPQIPLKDISEIDIVDEVNETLYIGPATLDALELIEAGAEGIILTSSFQGHNLLPYSPRFKLLSSKGEKFNYLTLFRMLELEIKRENADPGPYALYIPDFSHGFGSYLKSSHRSDETYPVYESHVVLWNYLLNLIDISFDIKECTKNQIALLASNKHVLEKLLRLHNYAVKSSESIYQESKSTTTQASVIQEHIDHLDEVEKISEQLASSFPMVRPVLDYYKIKKATITGDTLADKAQDNFLIFSEEHQALLALNELFSVTLNKNEATL